MENRIELEQRNVELVALAVKSQREKADVKAYEAREVLKAYQQVSPQVLEALAFTGMDSSKFISKAFMELGNNAEKIGTLNISPELLESLTKR